MLNQREKIPPSFPFWLAPIQARILTVSDKHLDYANTVLEALEKENIRIDLDDRSETVGKKIREAEMNWVPFVIVIGDQEVETKKLTVRIRKTGEKDVKLTLEELIEKLNQELIPNIRLLLPKPFRLVSTSPKFT
jgi:threonyl-tRNA synthetase